MISLLAFFLLLSSGSFYLSARSDRRYEETVPLTIFCAVEVVFLFGLLDALKLGFYVVCLAALALYALGLRQIVKEHSLKDFRGRFFTPAFFVFVILCVLSAWMIVGRVAVQGDEFSYWASSVKKMWYLGKLPCVPEAEPYFTEYPPGMQLLEYLAIGFYGKFSEWRMNFAYLIYLFSLFLPFLRNMSHRRPAANLLIFAVVLTSGSLIYADVYNNLMVDCALGMTFAFGMASVFVLKKTRGTWDRLQILSVIMAANMLVLIKSAGRLFAVILLLALVLSIACQERKRLFHLPPRRYIGGLFLMIPFVTAWFWKLKYTMTPAPVAFDEHTYDIVEFIRVLMGADVGYRSGIRTNFIRFLLLEKTSVGVVSLTNLQLAFLLALLIFVVAAIYRERSAGNSSTVLVLLCGVPIYWLGLMASYMYTFTEGEGTALASMQRYLNIYQSALVLFLIFSVLMLPAFIEIKNELIYNVLLGGVLLLVSPQPIWNFLTRADVNASIAARAPFEALAEQIRADDSGAELSEEKPCALLINRNGYPHVPVNHFTYLLWPDYRVPWECSYGSTTLFDGDYYTQLLTEAEFQQHVNDLGVNYIAIYCLDDDFIQQYSALFDAPLANGQVYRVTEGKYELLRETALT